MKAWQNDNSKVGKVSTKHFKFQQADEKDALEISGMEFNAITPFFMTGEGKNLPIILSQRIADLNPAYLWFSAGKIELKMGVSVADFCKYFGERVKIVDISPSSEGEGE
jgi:prolyl-tRNA editing enzyme YbaK/EbsC (Cys-tRNA(Pro) deacylase)